MTPSELRGHLLAQHEGLRNLATRAEEVALRSLGGDPTGEELRLAVDELQSALLEHNSDEERALHPILLQGDRMASQRIQRMLEEHMAEHAAMTLSLSGEGEELARKVVELVEDLRAHMAAEERTFLHPHALGVAQK